MEKKNDQCGVPVGFARLVERRSAHEPIAYITGRQAFYGLEFEVTPDVLIPRSDSEVLVGSALAARPAAGRILDCGTGSGALLISVLANMPEAQGVGIDRSREALQVAAGNAVKLGIDRAEFLERDWTAPAWRSGLGTFDLILANPPYVETGAKLAPGVRNFEPAGALFAGPKGLDAHRALLPQLPMLLRPDGAGFVEIGAGQADAVKELAGRAGLAAELRCDLENRPRVMELTRTR